MIKDKDADYHIQSIRSAKVREWLGGIKAEDSHLMQAAVGELMTTHGMTEEQIIAAYKAKWPQ
jgi:hypothetical protein